MQFLADIIKRLNEENKITIEDLYKLKESEVIQIIEKSRYNEIFNKWIANKMISNNLAYKMDNYVYLDFDFN